jgi:hypothetical protein
MKMSRSRIKKTISMPEQVITAISIPLSSNNSVPTAGMTPAGKNDVNIGNISPIMN